MYPSDQESLFPTRVTVLASGSKGNCILLESGGTAVLFDAGLSGRELTRRMNSVGFEPERLSAIFVSHEHTDHVGAVGVLSRAHNLPVYATAGAFRTAGKVFGRLTAMRPIRSGEPVSIGPITVKPFTTTHDTSEPVGFTAVGADECRIGICTDLGVATKLAAAELAGADYLILESNHDPAMLRDGPYPWRLKQRISSRHGHLSNRQCGELLAYVAHERLQGVTLAHLSEQNNDPRLAEESALSYLDKAGFPAAPLRVARQDKPLDPVVLRPPPSELCN